MAHRWSQKEHATKFVNQCRVIVRDTIPITVQEWNEPKKARVGASFVDVRAKKDLKKANCKFHSPPDYHKFDDDGNKILGGCERRRTVKEFAPKKMAEASRNY
jgi:hypothetical protein